LGLPPWADRVTIHRTLRSQMRRYHPDGTDPDPDIYARYAEIAQTLLHPDRKAAYDRLASGLLLVDSRVRQRADALGTSLIDHVEPAPTVGTHYDWFASRPRVTDGNVAQRWYRSLVAVAPIFGYTRAIRVLLHDEGPRWMGDAGMMVIPRSWEPTSGNAFALFAVVVPTK
jgi:curved DNA-binding protein CbpA